MLMQIDLLSIMVKQSQILIDKTPITSEIWQKQQLQIVKSHHQLMQSDTLQSKMGQVIKTNLILLVYKQWTLLKEHEQLVKPPENQQQQSRSMWQETLENILKVSNDN